LVLTHLRRRWSLSGFRRFRGNEMTIFLYAEVENWRLSRGRVPRYFLSIRRWLRRHRTLALGASDAGISVWWLTLCDGLLRKWCQMRLWSGDRRWMTVSIVSGVSSVAILGDDRHGAASNAHSTDASIDRLPISRALWTASVRRRTQRLGRHRTCLLHTSRPLEVSQPLVIYGSHSIEDTWQRSVTGG
jgi:hypothetical protein